MSARKKVTKANLLEIPTDSNASGTSIVLLVISVGGLIVSLVSGFHENIPFLKSLCTSACRNAAEILFLHLPFWFWGALFYLAAACLAVLRRNAATWLAGPAIGVEAVLILVMVQLKLVCLFCIANAALVLLFLAATFRKQLFWQQATLTLSFFIAFLIWVPFENDIPFSFRKAAAQPGHDGSGIAAIVGNEVITDQRLDVLLGARLFETRKQLYQMKMEKLDQLILQIVLDKEAKQQGRTADSIVDQIAPPGSVQVEESEIDKYMQENQDKLHAYQATIPDLRQRLRTFLEQQKRTKIIRDYIRTLEPKYGVRIFVAEPTQPKINVDTQGCPTLGPSNAPVTVVEFSDYQCPACRSTHPVVNEVRALYGDKIHWVYKEYPLKQHQAAFKAAEAAHCAEDQGKFWEYQERMFTVPDLSPENLVNVAADLGLSRDKFSQCLQDSKYKTLVEKNMQDASQVGVDRTPTFMINGTLFVGGPSLTVFKNLIDEELRKSGVSEVKKPLPLPQTVGKAQ